MYICGGGSRRSIYSKTLRSEYQRNPMFKPLQAAGGCMLSSRCSSLPGMGPPSFAAPSPCSLSLRAAPPQQLSQLFPSALGSLLSPSLLVSSLLPHLSGALGLSPRSFAVLCPRVPLSGLLSLHGDHPKCASPTTPHPRSRPVCPAASRTSPCLI